MITEKNKTDEELNQEEQDSEKNEDSSEGSNNDNFLTTEDGQSITTEHKELEPEESPEEEKSKG